MGVKTSQLCVASLYRSQLGQIQPFIWVMGDYNLIFRGRRTKNLKQFILWKEYLQFTYRLDVVGTL